MNWLVFAGITLFMATGSAVAIDTLSLISVFVLCLSSAHRSSLVKTASLLIASIGRSFLSTINWVPLVTKPERRVWPLPLSICGMFHYVETTLQFVMTLSLTIFAWEQYRRVRFQRGSKSPTVAKTLVTVAAVWAISASIALPELFFYGGEEQHCTNEHYNATVSKSFDVVKISVNLPVPLLLSIIWYTKAIMFFSQIKIPTVNELQLGVNQESRRLLGLAIVTTVLFLAASAIHSVEIVSKWFTDFYVPDAMLLFEQFAVNISSLLIGLFPLLMSDDAKKLFSNT